MVIGLYVKRLASSNTTNGLVFQWIIDLPVSWIVSPTYGGTVNSGLKPMTGMFLNRTTVPQDTLKRVKTDTLTKMIKI